MAVPAITLNNGVLPEPGTADTVPDLPFVHVRGGRVDMAVPERERLLHRGCRLFGRALEDARSKRGHRRSASARD